jgi:zinc transport system ATP-binding protein
VCDINPGGKCRCGVRLEHLSVSLGGVEVLKDVSTSFPCGEITALIGPNGAGKTTLLLAILGVVPYRGQILFHHVERMAGDGQNVPAIGYVPQNLQFDRGDPMTVGDFMALGMQRTPLWLWHRKWAVERARKYLGLLGAESLLSRPMGKLSGGQLQRVLLASALQLEPHVVLLDEPISGVDVAGERLFCKFLSEFQHEHEMTIVLVTHDLSVVSEHSDYVVCLNKDVKFQGRTKEVLTEDKIDAIFGLPKGLFYHTVDAHAEMEGNSGGG